MTDPTARDAPDRYVFGPHRGGVFAHPSLSGAPTHPDWCASCSVHRVEASGQQCPACEGEARRDTPQEAAGGGQTPPQPPGEVRTPGAAR